MNDTNVHLGSIIMILLIRLVIIIKSHRIKRKRPAKTHNHSNDELWWRSRFQFHFFPFLVHVILHHHHFNPIYMQSLHSIAEPAKEKGHQNIKDVQSSFLWFWMLQQWENELCSQRIPNIIISTYSEYNSGMNGSNSWCINFGIVFDKITI